MSILLLLHDFSLKMLYIFMYMFMYCSGSTVNNSMIQWSNLIFSIWNWYFTILKFNFRNQELLYLKRINIRVSLLYFYYLLLLSSYLNSTTMLKSKKSYITENLKKKKNDLCNIFGDVLTLYKAYHIILQYTHTENWGWSYSLQGYYNENDLSVLQHVLQVCTCCCQLNGMCSNTT